MAHNYLEKREQPSPDVQKRKYCDDCHREWSFATYEFTPEGHCPGCGSAQVRDIAVRGLYDSTTDPAEIVRALAGIPEEQMAAEREARQRLVKVANVDPPPATLQAEIPAEDLALAGAGVMLMPPPSSQRSFAAELD